MATAALGLALNACSVAPAAGPKDAGSQPDPTTPDQAEAALDGAEKDLQDLLLAKERDDEDSGTDLTPGQPARTGVSEHRREPASRCTRACKALGSMKRSAERLCDLAGADDERCRSAELRVEAATKLVRSSCPSCAQ